MSYRPSSRSTDHDNPGETYHRESHASSQQMTAGQLRMVDKQRELEAFMLVEVEGAKLKAYLDGFGDKMDVLGMGTEAVSKVVEHWQNVFRATHLALASLQNKRQAAAADNEVLAPGTLPERLVRIPTSEYRLEQEAEQLN